MLDTLRYAKHLQEAGVSREQAEAQAEALAQELRESIATREQVENVRLELKGEIESVRLELKGDIKQLYWMVGLSLSLNTAILVKLLVS